MRFRTPQKFGIVRSDTGKVCKDREMSECVCEFCGEHFLSYQPWAKCCGKIECKRKQKKQNNDKLKIKKRGFLGYSYKHCKICGKEFKPTTSHDKYCSKECEGVARRQNKNDLQKKYYQESKKNPKNIFAKALRKWVERCIQGKKNKRSCLYIEYTPEEFKKSIENKFKEGMNWDNYGSWHIDHIKPLCSFVFVNPDGSVNIEAIKQANSLENLQPLWAKENLSKGGKIE